MPPLPRRLCRFPSRRGSPPAEKIYFLRNCARSSIHPFIFLGGSTKFRVKSPELLQVCVVVLYPGFVCLSANRQNATSPLDPPFLSSPSFLPRSFLHQCPLADWQWHRTRYLWLPSLLSSLATLRHEYKNEAAGASEGGRQCGRLLPRKWNILLC